MSARGGGRGALAARMAFERDKNKKASAAHVAGRVALRAAQRVSWMRMDPEMEICKLQEQLKEVNQDADLETTEEYDYILNRFMQLEKQSNEQATAVTKKAVEDANKTEKFTCGICFAKQPLSTLRVLQPCGHGFCASCMCNIHICPNCRGPKTSVLATFL